MAAHRYWRVFHLTVNGGEYASWAEIEMFETIGGANVCVGGTASASSFYGVGYEPSVAFDGNKTTDAFWTTVQYQQNNSWIMYDFGAGNEKDIVEFAVTSRQASLNQTPRDFYLQWSDDSISWHTAAICIDQTGWTSNQTRTFRSYSDIVYSLARPYSTDAELPVLSSSAKNMFMTGGDGSFSGVARSETGGVPYAIVRAFDSSNGLIAGQVQANVLGEWVMHNLDPKKEYFLVCTNPNNIWEQVVSSRRIPYKSITYLNFRRTARTGETMNIDDIDVPTEE